MVDRNLEIRDMTPDDILDVVILGKQFVKSLGSFYGGVNNTKLRETLEQLVELEQFKGLVLCDNETPVGMLIGIVNSVWYSDTVLATELAYYVDEDYRGSRKSLELFYRFEEWAKQIGANYCIMSGTEELKSLDTLYLRKGYVKNEINYVKEL